MHLDDKSAFDARSFGSAALSLIAACQFDVLQALM
jgi:hypothetical protein